MPSRRSFSLALPAALLAPHAAQAQSLLALMAPGPLPEKIFGSETAKVTVIEYASLTCHHCMNFHLKTWPALKAKYVDAGKVRFVIREFPLDPLATAGFMLARCAGDDKWYDMIDLLYRTSENWAHSSTPAVALFETVMGAGFSRENFESCLQDDALLGKVQKVAEIASREYGVQSTPTFFVNGQRHVGALTIEQFDRILAPFL